MENGEHEQEFPINGYKSLPEFTQSVLKTVVVATQCGNALAPLIEEYEYWSSFPTFKRFCSEEGSRIVNDIGEMLRHNSVQCGWSTGGQSMNKAAVSDIEDRFDRLIDANDIMIENIGSLIDEASGVKKSKPILPPTMKQSSPIIATWNKKVNNSPGGRNQKYKLITAKNIPRPQLKWLDSIDNSNNPFVPYIKHKWHAIKSLDEDDENDDDNLDSTKDSLKDDVANIRHPYRYELSVFEPQDWQLDEKEPEMYSSLDETDLNMVYNQDGLDILMESLRDAQEIAIDLEHHSYRSFQGFVCLMQISTRDEDFIIDTLKLRSELHVLNEVFTDPKIVKVLHGADKDIQWLQHDFGLYIVNMFDTGQATRVLGEERYSLAYLLHKYCNVDAQKQFQLADWRMRPIPLEMLQYAREDTHYLLYIYDILRNLLIQRGNEMNNLLKSVYSKSAQICGTIYRKPILEPDSYLTVYNKFRGKLKPPQLECFRKLFIWRDKTARLEDESYGYTLPNHMMFQIAENLPKEAPGVIACCNPVPPLVKQNVIEIHRLVVTSRHYDPDSATNDPVTGQDIQNNNQGKYKDDLPATKEVSQSSKTGFELYNITGPPVGKMRPSLTIFDELVKEQIKMKYRNDRVLEILSILQSPFEMYLPNTGKEMVHPDKVNEKWKDAVKSKLEDKRDDKPLEEAEINSVKRKVDTNGEVEELTLGEMEPKKKKKKKDKSEEEANESPVTFQYNKTVKKTSDFVPFDYSKANMKKFLPDKKLDESQNNSAFSNTEEPKMGRVVKTKVNSKDGAKSMTFKNN